MYVVNSTVQYSSLLMNESYITAQYVQCVQYQSVHVIVLEIPPLCFTSYATISLPSLSLSLSLSTSFSFSLLSLSHSLFSLILLIHSFNSTSFYLPVYLPNSISLPLPLPLFTSSLLHGRKRYIHVTYAHLFVRTFSILAKEMNFWENS